LNGNPTNLRWLLFPLAFGGLWLAITSFLAMMSGWPTMTAAYPDREEQRLVRLGGQSGSMGARDGGLFRVNMSGILILDVCPSGLRVSIWRLFGPFSRPFFVPWSELKVRGTQIMFVPFAELGFEKIGGITLKIDRLAWRRLRDAAPDSAPTIAGDPPFSNTDVMRSALIRWLAPSAIVSGFFYLASRTFGAGSDAPPVVILIAFPTVMFGLATAWNAFRLIKR